MSNKKFHSILIFIFLGLFIMQFSGCRRERSRYYLTFFSIGEDGLPAFKNNIRSYDPGDTTGKYGLHYKVSPGKYGPERALILQLEKTENGDFRYSPGGRYSFTYNEEGQITLLTEKKNDEIFTIDYIYKNGDLAEIVMPEERYRVYFREGRVHALLGKREERYFIHHEQPPHSQRFYLQENTLKKYIGIFYHTPERNLIQRISVVADNQNIIERFGDFDEKGLTEIKHSLYRNLLMPSIRTPDFTALRSELKENRPEE